jgi:small subunit ribosomal protein S4
MGKYLGPKIRLLRKLGPLPGLARKEIKYTVKTPGQHGESLFKRQSRFYMANDYKAQLNEKQKLKFNYGVAEKQLITYYKQAKKIKIFRLKKFLNCFETRLDCIVYRLGFARTIKAARQLISHGHIRVNKKKVNIPSLKCEVNNKITIKRKYESEQFVLFEIKRREKDRWDFYSHLDNSLTPTSTRSTFNNKLPSHLIISRKNKLEGKIISFMKVEESLIKANFLKLIQYYSNRI